MKKPQKQLRRDRAGDTAEATSPSAVQKKRGYSPWWICASAVGLLAAVVLVWILVTAPARRQAYLRNASLRELAQEIQQNPRDSQALYYLGLQFLKLNRPDRAVAMFGDAYQINPDDDDLVGTLANTEMALNQSGEAKKTLTDTLKRNPGFAWCHLCLSELYEKYHQYPLAYQEAITAASLKPKFEGTAWGDAGLDAYNAMDYVNAETALKKSIALDPTNAQHQIDLASVYNEGRRFPEALVCLKKAVELAPNDPITHFSLGQTIFYSDKSAQGVSAAVQALQDALRLDPTDSDAGLILGQAYLQQRRWSDALAVLKTAEAADPKNGRIHFELLRAYRHLGDKAGVAYETNMAKKLNAN